jgi:hypothetical protein
VQNKADTVYRTGSLFVPVGSPVGWEAAVFDHFQAMVKTICCRLRDDSAASNPGDAVGGSTYTLDVWPGHPLQQEATATLSRLRAAIVDLRQRVEEHNDAHGIPEQHSQVVLYVGQCMIPQDAEDGE